MLRVRCIAVALFVVAFFAAPAVASDYEKLVEKFFADVKEGKHSEALTTLFLTNPHFEKKVDEISTLKSQFSGLSELVGPLLRTSLVAEKELGATLAYEAHLAVFDRQPLFVRFWFYKPYDKWVLLHFSYDESATGYIQEQADTDNLFMREPCDELPEKIPEAARL